MPMGGAGCGLAQSITGLLEQRQVNIELSSFDLIEPSRDPAFPRTISVSFAVGLPLVQRTQEQQQAESLHEVSEAWGRWSPQAPERHSSEHLPLECASQGFPSQRNAPSLAPWTQDCLWMDSTGKHGHSSEVFVLGR